MTCLALALATSTSSFIQRITCASHHRSISASMMHVCTSARFGHRKRVAPVAVPEPTHGCSQRKATASQCQSSVCRRTTIRSTCSRFLARLILCLVPRTPRLAGSLGSVEIAHRPDVLQQRPLRCSVCVRRTPVTVEAPNPVPASHVLPCTAPATRTIQAASLRGKPRRDYRHRRSRRRQSLPLLCPNKR